jgi:hypothetical protein
MTFEHDTAPFDDWGTTLTVDKDGSELTVLLGRPYAEDEEIAGERITGLVHSIPDLVEGDILSRGRELFGVVGVHPTSDERASTIALEHRGYRADVFANLDLVALGGPLRVAWIDEAYPGYPYVEDEPPNHDATLTTLRAGSPAGHVLFFVGPITAEMVPAAARIDSAELWVHADVGGAVQWEVHQVLANVTRSRIDWLQASTPPGHTWATPGCGGSGVDYAAANLGSGDEVPAGWSVLASGGALGRLLNANRAAVVSFVVRATGGAEASFDSELVSNGDLRPYLRIRYSVSRV